MLELDWNTEQVATTLAKLANGVIPADGRDAGAAEVDAGPKLASRLAAGVNLSLYRQGLSAAERLAQTRCGIPISALDAQQLHDLLAALQEHQPAFFRQLRMDVCALYLGASEVTARIGFPGPSIETGGYPDFDQPQM
jgi:hypothetical protein